MTDNNNNSTTITAPNNEQTPSPSPSTPTLDHRVHKELLPIFKLLPYHSPSFDSYWKVKLLSALMHIPGPTPSGVSWTKIGNGIGTYYYPVDDFGSTTTKCATAAILWIHPGGRVMGSASGATESMVISKIVQRFQVPVLSASYRLAPASPFPAALDDCDDAYKWLVERIKSDAGDDATNLRIVVAGESAGGGLAAELCQRLLDENIAGKNSALPLPVAQLLVYPMLDDRTCANENMKQSPDSHIIWNNKSNTYAWSSYLRRDSSKLCEDEDVPQYSVAARRKDLSNLPPAWIMVGDLDLFHEECKEYSRRLENAGVETLYLEIQGGFHGMFNLGRNEEPVVQVWESFTKFGRRHLFEEEPKE